MCRLTCESGIIRTLAGELSSTVGCWRERVVVVAISGAISTWWFLVVVVVISDNCGSYVSSEYESQSGQEGSDRSEINYRYIDWTSFNALMTYP